MTILLYTETNFLMSYATGRDVATDQLLRDCPSSISLVIPSFAFMEAYSTLTLERKRHNKVIEGLESEIGQAKRNLISSHARSLIDHLQQSVVKLRATFDDFEARLFQAVALLSSKAEVIESTAEILETSTRNDLIADPTDNLVLTSILDHATRHSSASKVLLTENRRDFETNRFARAALERAGVKYFADTAQCLDWHRAQPDS